MTRAIKSSYFVTQISKFKILSSLSLPRINICIVEDTETSARKKRLVAITFPIKEKVGIIRILPTLKFGQVKYIEHRKVDSCQNVLGISCSGRDLIFSTEYGGIYRNGYYSGNHDSFYQYRYTFLNPRSLVTKADMRTVMVV